MASFRDGDTLYMQRLLPPGHHIPVLVVCITQVDVESITSFEPNHCLMGHFALII